jgi:isopenicillin N synthase-like dioxygenase
VNIDLRVKVKNHRVPNKLIDEAFKAGQEFFDLPIEEKMKVRSFKAAYLEQSSTIKSTSQIDLNKSPNFRGYNAILAENVDPTNRGDLHEGFNMGPDEKETSVSMTGLNVWPDLPAFKDGVMPY